MTIAKEQVNPNVEQIPAGGLDSESFDVKEAWYPVYYLEDLDKNKPQTFTLLGINIVIWWDKSNQSWCVFEDKCPHRLAPLSEGRINEQGLLECPYHGWTFSGTGKCEAIPQQLPEGKAETSQRACANSLPCTQAQGLLFVYPGKPENAFKVKVPLVDVLEESPSEWVCLNTFRDIPYDAFTLLENVLDSSHIPYTHHRTVGNRANVAPVELEIVESGKQGFQGIWAEGPRKGTLGKQDTTFIAPNLMWHDLTSKQFGRTLTVVYATPIKKGECRLFAKFPFKFSSPFPGLVMKLTPRWYSHINQNGVLEDDQIFLHYQERYLEAAGGSSNFTKAFYLPTKADLFVFEFRQWINQYCTEAFPHQSLSPAWSKEQLLDRYHSHTSKCSSCSKALKNIQKLRKLAAIITIVSWVLAPILILTLAAPSIWSIVPFTVATLLFSAMWWQLGKLQRKFYQGQEIPPRNLPEKK
jgi:phenylpropionate dioxygenase-like ring-hydroxylating dioxygenase large terminal subunit